MNQIWIHFWLKLKMQLWKLKWQCEKLLKLKLRQCKRGRRPIERMQRLKHQDWQRKKSITDSKKKKHEDKKRKLKNKQKKKLEDKWKKPKGDRKKQRGNTPRWLKLLTLPPNTRNTNLTLTLPPQCRLPCLRLLLSNANPLLPPLRVCTPMQLLSLLALLSRSGWLEWEASTP
jgi:hypothetical protein